MSLEGVRVLGLGNVLMGDDAFGPWVAEDLLARWEFPDRVSVLDVGTPGLDLTPYLADAELVLLVDTVRADAPPGTLRTYDRTQLLARGPQPRVSPHDPGLAEALFTLDFAGCAPKDIVLIGVVPGPVESGVGLSPEVRKAVAEASSEVVERLRRFGLTPRARRGPVSPPWWEMSVSARANL